MNTTVRGRSLRGPSFLLEPPDGSTRIDAFPDKISIHSGRSRSGGSFEGTNPLRPRSNPRVCPTKDSLLKPKAEQGGTGRLGNLATTPASDRRGGIALRPWRFLDAKEIVPVRGPRRWDFVGVQVASSGSLRQIERSNRTTAAKRSPEVHGARFGSCLSRLSCDQARACVRGMDRSRWDHGRDETLACSSRSDANPERAFETKRNRWCSILRAKLRSNGSDAMSMSSLLARGSNFTSAKGGCSFLPTCTFASRSRSSRPKAFRPFSHFKRLRCSRACACSARVNC